MASLASLALSTPRLLNGASLSAPARPTGASTRPSAVAVRAQQSSAEDYSTLSRRTALASSAAAAAGALALLGGADLSALAAPPQSLPKSDDTDIKLCSAECEKSLEEIPLQTLPSGLQYRDIVVGRGPSPPVGFQVAADYVAMVPSGRVFDSSIEKKVPYIFRVGAGQVVPGLDEGILTMAVGGLRRLYVPGDLSFPKGLASAPGRPRVAPNSPVIFDVKLLYIPGLEVDDEE